MRKLDGASKTDFSGSSSENKFRNRYRYNPFCDIGSVAEEDPMSGHAGYLTGILAGALCLTVSFGCPAVAQDTPPNFAPNANIGWYAYNRQFIPPPSGPGPVRQDPERPYVSNDEFRVTGKQPSEQLADLNNPILQPWAREVVRKRNELVLAGKPANPPHASCWPVGVPGFLLRPMTEPMYFVQTPKEVVVILSSKQEIRHIYLTGRHSPDLMPSWYGESIGHYEADSLVVDTIGINDRTWLDGFGTPHTKQLHVVERFRLTEGGNVLEASIHVEDPGAFTMPWNGIQRFRQYEAAVRKVGVQRITQLASTAEGPLQEMICAENPNSFLPGTGGRPIPQTLSPDF
jgi:hypothetical protein